MNPRTWIRLPFGRHAGLTLPQVMFRDPDWLLWAYEEGIFFRPAGLALLPEALALAPRVGSVRVPQSGPERLVAEYRLDPVTGRFAGIELVPEDEDAEQGGSPTFRSRTIDLGIVRRLAPYDKRGGRILVHDLKPLLFGPTVKRISRRRANAFVENDANFELDDPTGR